MTKTLDTRALLIGVLAVTLTTPTTAHDEDSGQEPENSKISGDSPNA